MYWRPSSIWLIGKLIQKTAILDQQGEIAYELEYPIQQTVYSKPLRMNPEITFEVGPVIDGVVLPASTPSSYIFLMVSKICLLQTITNALIALLMFFPDVSRRDDPEHAFLPIGHPYFTLECLDSQL